MHILPILLLSFFGIAFADQKPIVVVIPSYNNELWCIQNIDSVLDQDYKNFRIIFIDDHSSDATLRLVKERVASRAQEHRVTFVENDVNRKQLANHYRAVHMCADYEIIVHLDGDDYFAHHQVLSKVNEVYQNPNVWITYGQFQEWPSGEKGRCEKLSDVVIRNNMFRHAPWVTSHLRTFYAGLFKRIKLADLLYDGTFFPCSADFAMMYPMLEMAGHRSTFIPDVLYLYNRQNPISYFRIAQGTTAHLEIHIRGKKKYEKLEGVDITQPVSRAAHCVDIILFSENDPAQLLICIKSLAQHFKGMCSLTILYDAFNEICAREYQQLDNAQHGVQMVRYTRDTFKKELLSVLERAHGYVFLMPDYCVAKQSCNLADCVRKLESTYAHAFHLLGNYTSSHMYGLQRSQSLPPAVYVGDDVYGWQYTYGEYQWRKPHTFECALYRVKDIKQSFQDMIFYSLQDLESLWHDACIAGDAVGLCYRESKMGVCYEGNIL